MKIFKKIIPKQNFSKSLFKNQNSQNKTFFIKFLINKGYVKIVNNQDSVDSEFEVSSTSKDYNYMLKENVDLKKLLDEKQVQINFRDIITDYRYYRKQFYSLDSNENINEYNHINVFAPKEVEDKIPTLPFNKTNITHTKVAKFYMFQKSYTNYSWFKRAIVIYLVVFYMIYKYHNVVKVNKYFLKNYYENIEKISLTEFKNDEFEKIRTV
jgi:hypothetical protein